MAAHELAPAEDLANHCLCSIYHVAVVQSDSTVFSVPVVVQQLSVFSYVY